MPAARSFFAVLLVLLALPALGGCRGDDESWARIQETGVLRVGLDPSYPPFEVDDGASLQGIDVDLARALAGELGLQAEFVYFGYDGLYDALLTEQVDVLISALVIQPERGEEVAYSAPYFQAGQLLVLPPGSAIAEIGDLRAQTIAVELGSDGHVQARDWVRQLGGVAVLPLATPAEALQALVDGSADAALVDAVSARQFRRDHPELRLLPEPVTVEPYAIAVRVDDDELLRNLDRALDALRAAGALDALVAGWLEGASSGG